jgi:hypothetical protein
VAPCSDLVDAFILRVMQSPCVFALSSAACLQALWPSASEDLPMFKTQACKSSGRLVGNIPARGASPRSL